MLVLSQEGPYKSASPSKMKESKPETYSYRIGVSSKRETRTATNRSRQSPSPIQRVISPLSSGIVSPAPPYNALSPSIMSGERTFSFKQGVGDLEALIAHALQQSEEIKKQHELIRAEIKKETREMLENTAKIERDIVPKIHTDYGRLKVEVKEARNEVQDHGKRIYELKRELKEIGNNLQKGKAKITSLKERLGATEKEQSES